MNCEKYEILIGDLLEGELDLQTAESVNSHIFSCGECKAEFELLKCEKAAYAGYLYDVEPPIGLSAAFKSRLESENRYSNMTMSVVGFIARVFGSIRLSPALAFGIAVIAIGLGFLGLKYPINEKGADRATILKSNQLDSQPVLIPQPKENLEGPAIASPEIAKASDDLPKSNKKSRENNPLTNVRTVKTREKGAFTNKPPVKKMIIRNYEPDKSAEFAALSPEDKIEIKIAQTLQSETAKQMGKIELLLRSFRNMRYAEGSDEFEIAYQKQQAGKLLGKNIQLRQQAENYGSILTNEMLSKVEPYLMEISNLDDNPSNEEILEIKQHVKNQNIIVSLQGF